MDFEWDEAKAESNERKHGVSFTEAMTGFADPLSVRIISARVATRRERKDDEDGNFP